MKKRIVGAKIACLDINLQKSRMQLGVQILVDDPDQLEEIRKRYVFAWSDSINSVAHPCYREAEITLERIRKILAAGANVVFTTKGIDDLCLKEFVEAGAMAVRRCRKEDLRRIARATGGQLIASMANLNGDETFEPSYLGRPTKSSRSASQTMSSFWSRVPKSSVHRQLSCVVQMTTCWMKWRGLFTIPCLLSSGRWKVAL